MDKGKYINPLSKKMKKILLITLSIFFLSACGFHLRGNQDFSFKRLFIAGGHNSEIGARIKRMVEGGSQARVVNSPEDADAILNYSVSQNQTALSFDTRGVAQEYTLTSVMTYTLTNPKGEAIVAPGIIDVNRSMTYSDQYVLAKENEKVMLYKDMTKDIVEQLMRRLAAKPSYIDETEENLNGMRDLLPVPPL